MTPCGSDDRLDEAYFLKGRLYLETGDTVTAASSFQTAIEVNSMPLRCLHSAGTALCRCHDEALALEYFRTARSLRPNSIEALYDEAIYLQEHGGYRGALCAQPLPCMTGSWSWTQPTLLLHSTRVLCILEYLTQYDSAAYWFDWAIERLPYYHQAHYNKGLAMESMGRTEDALAAYNTHCPLHQPTPLPPWPRAGCSMTDDATTIKKPRRIDSPK